MPKLAMRKSPLRADAIPLGSVPGLEWVLRGSYSPRVMRKWKNPDLTPKDQ